MQLTTTGKQIDIGDALRRHIEATLGTILEKYFKTAIEAHVVISREAHLVRAEVSLHIGRGIEVNAHASASEAYPAFDAAAERLAKQLRRYKRRLRDYHAKARDHSLASERAMAYVLAPLEEETGGEGTAETEVDGQGVDDPGVDDPGVDDPGVDDPGVDGQGGGPAVIAEMSTELPNLTVGEAVMRMDLADVSVLLFRNRSHGELNLIYRRSDGNIGWIDPQLDPARRADHRSS